MLNIKEIILEQQNNLNFKLKNKNCKVLKLIGNHKVQMMWVFIVISIRKIK